MKLSRENVKKTTLIATIYIVGILLSALVMLFTFQDPSSLGDSSERVFMASFFILLALLVSGGWRIRRNFSRPVKILTDATQQMVEGNHDIEVQYEVKNEIRHLIRNVNAINSYIKNALDFVRKIEAGDLEANYPGLEKDDAVNSESLIYALLSMRTQIKQFTEQENQQKWVTQGLASFIEILRGNHDNLKTLYDHIISELVKYTGANQGAMFLINNFTTTSDQNLYLEMVSCYAYDRLKFINQKIEKGEGLVGQSWQEKDILYYTDIPENYAKITSGLGGAPPRSILIIPLMINENVYGILELASFENFPEYKRDFVAKISENIASTIANLKNVEQTKHLLQESQEQSEQMRAQEEEMRQNVEELTATQEEMRRKQSELESTNQRMKENEKLLQKLVKESSDKELQLIAKTRQLETNMKDLEETRFEMEEQQKELQYANEKMKANESILKKAFGQTRTKEREIKKQNAELAKSKELLEKQTAEITETNQKLQANEMVLRKAFQKMRTKEQDYKQTIKELEAQVAQFETQNSTSTQEKSQNHRIINSE